MQEEHKVHERALARLNRLAGLAWLALFSERLWRRLWPPVGIILLFLSLAWLGFWQIVPPLAHLAGLMLFALGLLYSCKGFLSLRRPDVDDALKRVDRDSGLAHGDAAAMNDRLALGRNDQATRALWLLHRKRVIAVVPKMRVAWPVPDMPRHDRYAIRSGLVLLAIASAFIAGPDKGERLLTALSAPLPGFASSSGTIAVSGWINPPAYTGLPPQVVSFAGAAQKVQAPVGSTLVIRAAKEADIKVSSTPALSPPAGPANKDKTVSLAETVLLLDKNSSITVSTGFFHKSTVNVAIIPDQPPQVALKGDIAVNLRGSFVIPYTARDDYGVTDLKAVFTLDPAYHSLVPAPDLPLAVPLRKSPDEIARQTVDFSEHPWAGLPVTMTLIAHDALGQEGRSEPFRFVLPQRSFTVPLAQSLAELRRRLVTEPEGKGLVDSALEGLMFAPERFTPEAGVFLGLSRAADMMQSARSNADLVVLSEWLWAMAVEIEGGSLSGAERDLKAAQERLQDAIARNADPKEMAQAMQEMREAMDRYLQQLAQRMRENQKNAQAQMPGAKAVTSEDLSRMLERIEQLMRQGRQAEAQALMDQLRNIFDNMQSGRPGGPMSSMMKEMMEAMKQAESLLSEQQKLRDETYEQNRQGLMYPDEKEPGDNKAMKDLEPRQKGLRQKLDALRKQGKALGLKPDSNLDDAEDAMRDAEDALGQNEGSDAVDAQGRAIQSLQKGAQNMMQQAQDMFGNDMGGGTQEGRSGNPNPFNGKANTRDVRDRIQDLIETLRQKLADPARPKEELDYFDRLLRQ